MLKLLEFFYRLFVYRSIILGSVTIGDNVWIRYSYIKGNITIGTGATIFRSSIVGNINLGSNCSITGPYTYLHSLAHSITVGDRSAIGPGTIATTVSHDRNAVHKTVRSGCILIEEDINLGTDVWLGAGTRLLAGAIINNNVTIGAGAVVLKGTYISDSMYAGVPAKLK